MHFDFFNVPRIVFGRGTIARLNELIPQSSRPLVIYNGAEPQVAATARFRQRGEPTVADIDAALAFGRDAQCDFVIGHGGGSAIDAAKAVAGLLANGGVASDYMEVVGKGQKITKSAVPWIAIPTTAGTGAEATRNAVIGWPEKKFKASIRSEFLLARVALIDPQLGLDVPPDVTARSGMDALCQCIEAYVSTGANPMSDALALKGVELAGRFLRRAFDDGRDIEAREGMALAALFSGIALTNAGLGAVHGFAAPLGANFPAPHGTICGVLLPHVIRANRAAGVAKYAEIDRALGGDAHEVTASLVRDLKVPPLSVFGIRMSDVEPMVKLARRASSMRFNPAQLTDETLADILRRGIGEDVCIRPFAPRDALAFRELNEEWLKKYFRLEPKDVKVLGDPQRQIIDSGGAVLMLDCDGQTVGCCALVRLDEHTLEVAKMAVAQTHQGRGLGKMLLQACIAHAKSMGATRLYLESSSKLAPALSLYRKLGFADVPLHEAAASEYQRVDVVMEMKL